SQKASLTVNREQCFSFSLGGKGYVGAGVALGGFYNFDLYEYNPGTNGWTSKANMGTIQRYGAAAFTLGGKAYVSGGLTTNDFWEYTAATNTWVQKINFAGAYRWNLTAFS